MIKLLSIIFLSLLFLTDSHTQHFTIKGKVENMPDIPVYLAYAKGDDQILKDSLAPLRGEITFKLSEESENGMYKIILGKTAKGAYQPNPPHFELIFNNENIHFRTSYNNPVQDMQFIASGENKLFYRFVNSRIKYNSKFSHLRSLIDTYEKEDPFYESLRNEFIKLQKDMNDSIILWSNEKPESLASSVMMMFLEPVYDPATDGSFDEFMQLHYFDPVNMDDPALLNTPVYNRKILNYLSFFPDSEQDRRTREHQFLQAVDIIMKKASYSQEVYDFVLNFLIDGFEQLQMEEVLIYIADNYLEGECETDSKRIMEERLQAYQNMAPGKKVNDILLLDLYDEPRRMSETKSKYTLLLFWASWCPHCQNLLPRLKKWLEEDNTDSIVSLYTVSIDTSRFEWEEFVLSNDLPGIHVLEPEGWEGKYSREFNIYATPTMFILDHRRKIVAKPVTFREFKRTIKDLGT